MTRWSGKVAKTLPHTHTQRLTHKVDDVDMPWDIELKRVIVNCPSLSEVKLEGMPLVARERNVVITLMSDHKSSHFFHLQQPH